MDRSELPKRPVFKPSSDGKTYYDYLGVAAQASPDEIKKSFRKIAMECHPDKTASLSAEQRSEKELAFKNASEAYAALSDAATRTAYDEFLKNPHLQQQGSPVSTGFPDQAMQEAFAEGPRFTGGNRKKEGFSSIFGSSERTREKVASVVSGPAQSLRLKLKVVESDTLTEAEVLDVINCKELAPGVKKTALQKLIPDEAPAGFVQLANEISDQESLKLLFQAYMGDKKNLAPKYILATLKADVSTEAKEMAINFIPGQQKNGKLLSQLLESLPKNPDFVRLSRQVLSKFTMLDLSSVRHVLRTITPVDDLWRAEIVQKLPEAPTNLAEAVQIAGLFDEPLPLLEKWGIRLDK